MAGHPAIKTKPRVPVEVCERIIEFLFTDYPSEAPAALATLSSCALVCRDWRPRAQRVLFEYVVLRDKDSLYRFAELLNASPELAGYVRMLALRGYLHVPSSPVILLPTVLRGKLTHLQELHLLELDDQEKIANPLPEGKEELPSLPIHPLYPSLLARSSISHIRRLELVAVTFPSFGDFARTLNTLSNLEDLRFRSVVWAVLGQEPLCVSKHRSPGSWKSFLSNLELLQCYDVEEQGRQRLISALGPSLQELWFTLPNRPPSARTADQKGRSEDKVSDTHLPLDFKSVPKIGHLSILLRPLKRKENLMIQSLKDTLASWITSGADALSDDSALRVHTRCLYLGPWFKDHFTRQDFAHLLHAIGPVVEAALCTKDSSHAVGDEGDEALERQVDPCQARLIVDDLDDKAEWKDWWEEQASECFPTFAKWKHLMVDFEIEDSAGLWEDYHKTPLDPPEVTSDSEVVSDSDDEPTRP